VKLPRDLSGHEFANLLRRYGYEVIRQSGSHLQLRSGILGTNHTVTEPAHKFLRTGTQNSILARVAQCLRMDRSELLKELFGR